MGENFKADASPNQRDRFIEAAKQLGADEDEPTFKAKLARIARQKAKDEPAPAGEAQPTKAPTRGG